LDDAARRLSKYFLTQLGINATFGLVIGVGLYFIGVPNPVLWGMLSMLLRFVPYIGSFIAAGLPIALAAAVDPGWSMAIWTAALYIVIELLVGQAVEPMVYGHSTGLSPLAVVVAAIFWSWLWGPIGLILSKYRQVGDYSALRNLSSLHIRRMAASRFDGGQPRRVRAGRF